MSAAPYLSRREIEAAIEVVRPLVLETPLLAWPQISRAAGCDLWVKHENHTPIGAFKIRGGLTYMRSFQDAGRLPRGVVAGTRGNHGQSVALAAARLGLGATIVVPKGNSAEKNDAMAAFGADVVVHGEDFQEALEHAAALAERDGLHFVPAFDRRLVVGVATYAWELFQRQPDLDRVYVPVGLGSGICGTIAARDALGRKAAVVGVVAENAPAYARSFEARAPRSVPPRPTIADGVACRTPNDEALDVILRGAERIVAVGEEEVRGAMRLLYRATHNLAEGAGALALAAAIKERPGRNERVAVILSGGNVDWPVYEAAHRR